RGGRPAAGGRGSARGRRRRGRGARARFGPRPRPAAHARRAHGGADCAPRGARRGTATSHPAPAAERPLRPRRGAFSRRAHPGGLVSAALLPVSEGAERLAHLVEDMKILVCVGSGGVGKTTTAAMLALYGAAVGKR